MTRGKTIKKTGEEKTTKKRITEKNKVTKAKKPKKPVTLKVRTEKEVTSKASLPKSTIVLKKNEQKQEKTKQSKSRKNPIKPKKEEIVFDEKVFTITDSKKPNKMPPEKDKNLLIWAGVIFFMFLILIYWIFSMKINLEEARTKANPKSFSSNWNELAQELDGTINSIKEGIDAIKEFSTESQEFTEQNSLPITQSDSEEILTEKIKQKLEERVATGTKPYFEMPEDEKISFFENLNNLQLTDEIENVIAIMGQADFDQTINNQRGFFASRNLSYFIKTMYEDRESELDELLILEFDADEKLSRINRENLNKID